MEGKGGGDVNVFRNVFFGFCLFGDFKICDDVMM